MKKLIIGVALVAFFMSQVLYANTTIFEPHKEKKGKDDATVNCAYCHTKAGIEKKDKQDLEKLKKGSYCAIEGCHK